MQAYADPITGLDLDSGEYRKRAPRVELSNDPDVATQQTVQYMAGYIHQAARDPLVQGACFNAVRNFRGGPVWAGSGIDPFTNAQCMAESCWWWCKWNLRFKHHGQQFEAWSRDLGDPRTKLQLLIAPDVLVRMRKMEGDCAIYTMMVCAMLEALGLPWQILTLAVDAHQPEIFSHVCARSNSETLDASHGSYPGWQVPDYDIHRAWVFDSNGNKVSDQSAGMGRFTGLHAYRSRGRRRGMGTMLCDETGCYDDGTVDTSPTSPGYANPVSDPYPVGSIQAPSQNSAQWATFATNLSKMGFTLAEINSIQPGTVVSANGAILRQATGLPVPIGGSSLTTAFGSGNSLLYIGLAAAVALFAFSGKR